MRKKWSGYLVDAAGDLKAAGLVRNNGKNLANLVDVTRKKSGRTIRVPSINLGR